jgi:type IV pilus assembly protein PilB
MESSIEETLNSIIKNALLQKASDIHIDPTDKKLVVLFRIDGLLVTHSRLPLSYHEGVMLRIKVLARLPLDDRRLPKDGRFKWSSEDGLYTAEIRVSMMPTIFGENAVLRLFDPLMSFLSFKDLGFSEVHVQAMEEVLSFRSGLIVLAGPTGSGKTTTLYSMVDYIRKNSSRLIVTVEDPVEQKVAGIRQIEVGSGSMIEYSTVLKSILRQDPDVIVLGEIRDKESADLAFHIALTGHLVITTLHASSVIGIKHRLVNMGVSEYVVDEVLVFALSQRLLEKSQGSGRVAVAEILSDPAPLYEDAYNKALNGTVSFESALALKNEYAH